MIATLEIYQQMDRPRLLRAEAELDRRVCQLTADGKKSHPLLFQPLLVWRLSQLTLALKNCRQAIQERL
ncbi:MAG: hypothetical protein ABJZ55_01915 [Fuerstiella sp.]